VERITCGDGFDLVILRGFPGPAGTTHFPIADLKTGGVSLNEAGDCEQVTIVMGP